MKPVRLVLTASATPELHSSNTSLSDFVFFKVGAARFGEAGFGDAVYEDIYQGQGIKKIFQYCLRVPGIVKNEE